jgi:hypothetical protein
MSPEGRAAGVHCAAVMQRGFRLAFLGVGGALLLVGLMPLVGARLVRSRLDRAVAHFGGAASIGRLQVGFGQLVLEGLKVGGETAAPLLDAPLLEARFSVGALLLGRIDVREVTLHKPRFTVRRGGEDNVTPILERLHEGHHAASVSGSDRRPVSIALVRILNGAFTATDDRYGELRVGRLNAELRPDGIGEARLEEVTAKISAGPTASARKVVVVLPLERGRPKGLPTVQVEDAAVTPFRGLLLTDIFGGFKVDVAEPAKPNRLLIDLRGSYAGAKQPLWNTTGWFLPDGSAGQVKIRADHFRLAQLDRVFGRDHGALIVDIHEAEVDGGFDFNWQGGGLDFGGAFHLRNLSLAHPMLAPVMVRRVGFDASTRGRFDLGAKTLHLEEAAIDFRNLHASLTAEVENVGRHPRFSATLQVKPLSCQDALESLPKELVPILDGFKLAGTFSTDLHLALDLSNLDAPIDLGGKVGIEGCRALAAPKWVSAGRLHESFFQTVELEPGKWRTFFVGADNPDYIPYAEISPHLVNAIMTTEDSGFFRHRGFIPSEFRSALQQNLQRGYFRLGASSITMQMVKNVLLSREKTLSRKLQEMFLTWYLEHQLSKERILEIYFNVIEFGPGIFGIGPAVHHYFGKSPKELTPREVAWFSSILPNPKKRYVQFCHGSGQVDAKWDNYLKRILRRMHERGRLTDEEYEEAISEPLTFDRKEALPERDCMALVKRVTAPLSPPSKPH